VACAFVDIKKWYFDEALDKLLDAKELDPDGEKAQPVKDAYAAIEKGSPAPKLR